MRTYLTSFFQEFAYDEADAKTLLSAYDRISSSACASRVFADLLAEYDQDCRCDYARMIADCDRLSEETGLHEYTLELLLFLCLSKRLEARYAECGIDREIFYHSMLDLRYKLAECKAVKGIVGSFVAYWFPGFFDLTRFAFGRLQFETVPLKYDYEKDGKSLKKGSLALNVHIPRSGLPLDETACREAYGAAAQFFADRLEGEILFVCDSWLLYPENKNMLPEASNIRRFMERYDLIAWGHYKDNVDLWRLFDTDEQNPDRLPTDTTFRRNYVSHLKQGGRTGWGYGAFFSSEI